MVYPSYLIVDRPRPCTFKDKLNGSFDFYAGNGGGRPSSESL